MICRIWRAQATAQNAQLYQDAALKKIIPSIEARRLPGFANIDLLRRAMPGGSVEFSTLMWFDAPQDIVAFSGPDAEAAYLPPEITAVLERYDLRAAHFEVVAQRLQP